VNAVFIELPAFERHYYWNGGPEFWLFTLYDKDEMVDLSLRQRAELKERVKGELKTRRKT